MNNTVLITGGAGNLACQLCGMLEERGHRVVLIGIAKEPVVPVGTDTVYMQVDITDADALDTAIASSWKHASKRVPVRASNWGPPWVKE